MKPLCRVLWCSYKYHLVVYWLSCIMSLVYQASWPNGYDGRFTIKGSWVRVPLWERIFHFVIFASAPFSSRIPMQMKSTMTMPSQYPVLDNSSLKKIWLPFPVVHNFSFNHASSVLAVIKLTILFVPITTVYQNIDSGPMQCMWWFLHTTKSDTIPLLLKRINATQIFFFNMDT